MRAHVIPVLATLLVVAAMVWQGRSDDPVLCEAPSARLGEIAGFTSEPLEPSESERTILPADTQFDKRLYTAPDGTWYQVSLVIGGKSKSSIHRPELCLPSQGFQMMNPRSLDAGGVAWHAVTLARGTLPPLGFAYTFFNQDGFRTSSHVRRILRDVIDRSFRARIDRWAMVTVNAARADDASLAAFLLQLRDVVK